MVKGRKVKYSRAKRCFVCRRNIADVRREDDPGTVVIYYRHVKSPYKYERLCCECSKNLTE
jgi:hypothetical protein